MQRKSALVTGAGRGIGHAIALKLASDGYDLGINYNQSKETALELCNQIKNMGSIAVPLQANLSDLKELHHMFDLYFETFSSIDLLVNNAGLSKFYPFLEVTEDNFNNLIFTDWRAAFFATQCAAKNMIDNQKQGVIINLSSNQMEGCWPNANLYGPIKAALTKFGKHAAMELAPYGIRVITIAPGYTDVKWDENSSVYQAKNKIPLKRFAEPEEIANIISYLACDACSYMTGNCVTVDGGALLPVLPENYYYN